jgi:DNA-directed RNA polymerase subunit RPC12/RpoP
MKCSRCPKEFEFYDDNFDTDCIQLEIRWPGKGWDSFGYYLCIDCSRDFLAYWKRGGK